jgi:uncharacterized protein YhhL (DUF1145 family)
VSLRPRQAKTQRRGRALLILKLACLALYASALAGTTDMLPTNLAGPLEAFALVVVVVHALEMVLAFRSIRRYPHGLALSLLLTLLFGALHWLPLARRAGHRPET